MQRALWRAGWKTLVNLSSLFLTHCLTFVSTLLYLVKQRSWRDRQLDKWMGQTHVCTSVFATSLIDIVHVQPHTLTLTCITKCWTLCPTQFLEQPLEFTNPKCSDFDKLCRWNRYSSLYEAAVPELKLPLTCASTTQLSDRLMGKWNTS